MVKEDEDGLRDQATKCVPVMLQTLLTNDEQHEKLIHDESNASIILDSNLPRKTPWTPKSLGRAKTALIYKQTLNDTLLVLERNIFYLTKWVLYFVSLQDNIILLFATREQWEQGLKPDKIIELHHNLLLGEMNVDVVNDFSSVLLQGNNNSIRLFRRKIVEVDEIGEWLNEEFRQSLVASSGNRLDDLVVKNRNVSPLCILEFGSYNQNTLELWTKAIRHILAMKQEIHVKSLRNNHSSIDTAMTCSEGLNKCWVSPGQDSKVTLLRSEIWCNRVLSGEKEKAESEIRRIVAMEKLVAQVTDLQRALLVYEKVSRVHELFSANSKREIENLYERDDRMSAEVLNFFADHLKRKYSVFLILALVYGVKEVEIRTAHERMCHENAAVNAGVGGGSGEHQRTVASYGFLDLESLELYNKYRDAASKYYKVNYGDTTAAEEEDAIMHLPVMLQVAVIRQDLEESSAMLSILNTVKHRLMERCTPQDGV